MSSKGDNSLAADANTVLTADLVKSTARRISQKQLTQQLSQVFHELSEFLGSGVVLMPFVVTRGDSFQGVLKGVKNSFLAALYLRCAIRTSLNLDVRVAIGIGTTEELVAGSTLESSGQAFVRSGRRLDQMSASAKDVALISVDSGETPFDEQLNTCFALFEGFASRWTDKECEAVFLKLHNWTQTDIAQHLGIHQSAVHKRLKAASWSAVLCLLQHWQRMINSRTCPDIGEGTP